MICYRVLNCPISDVKSSADVENNILAHLELDSGFYTVAINAEKIMLYNKKIEMRKIIDNSELPYIDGSGALLGLKLLYGINSKKINMPKIILEVCNKNEIPLFMLGANKVTIIKAVESVKIIYENINLVGYHHGFFDEETDIVNKIKESGARIIMIAMGSPRQELLAQRLLKELPSCVFIGCGGAFDILAGNVKRAPEWIQNIHLEWFYRLLQDPRRIKRQKVLPVFLMLILKEYFSRKYVTLLKKISNHG